MRLLNKESQTEKEYEMKRKEYANCYSIAIQLIKFELDDDGAWVNDDPRKPRY